MHDLARMEGKAPQKLRAGPIPSRRSDTPELSVPHAKGDTGHGLACRIRKRLLSRSMPFPFRRSVTSPKLLLRWPMKYTEELLRCAVRETTNSVPATAS